MKKPPFPANETERLEALGELGILYSPSEERFDRITKLARKVFDVPIVLISLVADECQWFKSAQGITAAETPREVSFCGHAILRHEALVVPDAMVDSRFSDNPLVTGPPNIRFYAGYPIEYRGKNLGTLCLIDTRPRTFSMNDREDLKSMALWVQNEISMTALSESQLELLKELGAAKRRSMIDPLTKTWNRQGILELLNKEMARARREQESVSLMMIDIDGFDSICDARGQDAADQVLMETAQRIRSAVRPQDLMGRLDGDRFLLFLGACFNNRAAGIAQRMLAVVSEEPVVLGDDRSVKVTLSAGASCMALVESNDFQPLMQLAEEALAQARREGGNRARINTLSAED